jgi:predicted aldo/keto reductase-like oxidoreductase
MTKLRDDCLAKAHETGMGIVAMKVMGGGWLGRWSGYLVPGFDKQRLVQLPGAAIRHVLQDKRVHLWAIGMHLKSQIDANIKIVSSDGACTAEDRALLAEFSAKLYETDTIKKMRIE